MDESGEDVTVADVLASLDENEGSDTSEGKGETSAVVPAAEPSSSFLQESLSESSESTVK